MARSELLRWVRETTTWRLPALFASNEIGLETNAGKTKYMVMSRDQNAGQNDNLVIGNTFFERVEQFRYFGTTLTNQN